MVMIVRGTILHEGEAHGPTLVLDEPLSFWGAFDPRSGKIVDVHHPQSGATLQGHVLLLRETRGSGGTPGGIAEAMRRGTGPRGIILVTPDINLAVGAAVATTLYGRQCPVITVNANTYNDLVNIPTITIKRDGTIQGH
jgi:uncharacterized protein